MLNYIFFDILHYFTLNKNHFFPLNFKIKLYYLSQKGAKVTNALKIRADFQSRRRHMQTWLVSLHNHIKITTKTYNNYHWFLSEIELNRSLTTTELRKPHPSRLIGGVQTWNRLVPYPCVVNKNSGGISQERGVSDAHQAPLNPGSNARKRSPHNFWLRKSVGI